MSSEEMHEIEMPAPSFWPFVLAFSLLLICIGIIATIIVSIVGVILLLASIVGWSMENRAAAMHGEAHHE